MSIGDIQGGGFPFKGPLSSAVMNLVRTYLMQAVDGLNGGVYTLASKLTFNGTDMFELGDKLLYTSASNTILQPLHTAHVDLTEWTTNNNGVWQTVGSPAGARPIEFWLPALPHGNVLNTVSVYFKGGTPHGGSPTMPTLKVYRRAKNVASATQIGSTTTFTYGSAGAYEANHVETVTSLAHTIDRSANEYWIEIVSEAGANRVGGAQITAIEVTTTITKQAKVV